MRTSTYAAAIAVPALLAFTTIAPETISFAPKAGTTVTKTFTTVTEMELEDAEVLMGGQPAPIGEAEMAMESTLSITVSDTYGPMADGQLEKLSRTFDSIGHETEMDMTMGMAQEMAVEGTSPLEGKTVEFVWNEKDGEYEITFAEGEEGEPEDLEGLDIEMDLTGLLPDEDISVGESYEIDTMALAQIISPGGDPAFEMEVDGSAGGGPVPGADPGQMGDFSAFFQDTLEGDASGKLVEIRDADGVKVAVIELEFDVTGSADLTEMVAESMQNNDELPPGVSMDVDRMEMAMTYEAKGELLWNLDAGHVHSLEIEGDATTEMDMGMTINGEMEISMDMAMAGKVTTTVTTE